MRSARLTRSIALMASLLALLAVDGCKARKPEKPTATTVVSTAQGQLRGAREGTVASYKGIPYAAAPVGALRWRPPQAASSWKGVREAWQYGNDCMQKPLPFAPSSKQEMSEDCLYLNVWAPVHAKHPLPVMVWLHGGGLTIGSGSIPTSGGYTFARKDVVLVTLNYRLGRFGFFMHPALKAAHPDEPTGDYGLMDQIAALKWVKRNIADFGGNPDNVTVFGQSAGGVSILHLMAMPSARGLFAKAIVESGGGREHWAQPDRDIPGVKSAVATAMAFASKEGIEGTGLAAARALRALPAKKVLGDVGFFNANSPVYSGPVIDGTFVPLNTDAAFRAKAEAPIPLLIGTNDDELGKIPAMFMGKMTAKIMEAFGMQDCGLKGFYEKQKSRPEDLADDMSFVEPARFIAREHAATGAPVWLYRFAYVPADKRKPGRGARHTEEIPYVLGSLDDELSDVTPQDRQMSEAVQNAWIAFARTGDPNAPGLATWPRYVPGGKIMLFGDAGPAAVADPLEARLDRIAQCHARQSR